MKSLRRTDEAERHRDPAAAHPGAAIPVTISGAGTGRHRRPRAVRRLGAFAREVQPRWKFAPGYAIAGAGVLLRDLHAAAPRRGQFYPPDPTETSASIGGNIATNASGSRSFRYGATRRAGAAACAWC